MRRACGQCATQTYGRRCRLCGSAGLVPVEPTLVERRNPPRGIAFARERIAALVDPVRTPLEATGRS